jgi:SAM-dependent methyltransferase
LNQSLLDDLRCPSSGDPLRLAGVDTTAGNQSELVCDGCGARWPIRDGIPRLVPGQMVEQQRKTARAFGWQWQHFSEMHSEFEGQFLDWIYPLDREFFPGKRVLDAGCGTGRHAFFAASYGAREVVALDVSDAVETARRTLERFDNVDVIQGDLLRPPLRGARDGGGFDLVYCIGVLHHLPDPHEGFRTLLEHVAPGGTLAVWVYGYENNGFVRNIIEPVRRISTRIPPQLLRSVAWPLALGFHGAAKLIYRPLEGTTLGRALPLNEYMSSVADFSFQQNYGIVFDQLVAPTAAYIRGDEIESWFSEAGLADVEISHRHQNSWRGRGRVPG